MGGSKKTQEVKTPRTRSGRRVKVPVKFDENRSNVKKKQEDQSSKKPVKTEKAKASKPVKQKAREKEPDEVKESPAKRPKTEQPKVEIPAKKSTRINNKQKTGIAAPAPVPVLDKKIASKARKPPAKKKTLKPTEIEDLLNEPLGGDDANNREGSDSEDEVSFKQSPVKAKLPSPRKSPVKRVPIYKKFTENPKPTKSNKVIDASNIYDTFDSEDFADDENDAAQKKKKKKRKPRAKKQKADIILAFGSVKKDRVAPVLKQLKNLKTPVVKATSSTASAILQLKKPVTAPARRPFHDSVFDDPQPGPSSVPDSVANSPKAKSDRHESDADIPPDDFVDDFIVDYGGDDNDNAPEADKSPPVTISITNDQGKELELKKYKTPALPRKITKFTDQRKVSTPRVDAQNPAVNKKVKSKEELMQCNFGFDSTDDDLSEDCGGSGNKTDNESLAGFSPVKRVSNLHPNVAGNLSLASPNASKLNSTRMSINSCFTTTSRLVNNDHNRKKETAKPTRFEFKLPTMRKPNPSRPQPTSKRTAASNRTAPSSVNRATSAKPSSTVTAPKKQQKPVVSPEQSLYGDLVAEDVTFDTSNPAGDDNKNEVVAKEVDGNDEPEEAKNKNDKKESEEDLNVTKEKENAFDVLTKKKSLAVPEKKVTRKRKVVVTKQKKKKQALIYEQVAGGSKQLKSAKAKTPAVQSR